MEWIVPSGDTPTTVGVVVVVGTALRTAGDEEAVVLSAS
jgi:hypothetical protein